MLIAFPALLATVFIVIQLRPEPTRSSPRPSSGRLSPSRSSAVSSALPKSCFKRDMVQPQPGLAAAHPSNHVLPILRWVGCAR